MKRSVVTILIICLCTLLGYGQTFEVSPDNSFSGQIGTDIEGNLAIRNLSDQPITLGIKRLEANIGTGQETWFCLDENCLLPDEDEGRLDIEIQPGETFDGFRSVLKAGLGEGYSSVKYLITDRSNPGNDITVEVNYAIREASETNALFNSRKLIINDVYPNPVSDFAIVDYAMLDPDSEAKIVLHSVLGSIVGEYKLQPLETKLKINASAFNPGVYFYTLYIENDGVMTRKLIVRK